MFKNAILYRLTASGPLDLAALDERLASARFVECGATQPESAGWIEPRGEKHGALVESVAGQVVLRLAVETKSVPGSAVKQQLEAALDQVEQDTGRRPRGKRAKELKEQIVHALLPRAFPKRFAAWVWIDPKAGLVVIDAGSVKKADRIVTLLVELLGQGAKLAPVNTATAPATAMSTWLRTKEAPAGFSIDRDCELKQPDSEKATVKYARHSLDIDEVGVHIEQGKVPTQLAMTWSGRVSFVLNESLVLKRIKLLDVVTDAASADDGGFDTDVAIATGELRQLIPDLLAALDGEQALGVAAAERAEPAEAVPAAMETADASDLPPWEA